MDLLFRQSKSTWGLHRQALSRSLSHLSNRLNYPSSPPASSPSFIHNHNVIHHDNRLFTGSFMSSINNNMANSRNNNNNSSNVSTTNTTSNRHRANRHRDGRGSARSSRSSTNTRNPSTITPTTSHTTSHNTTNSNIHNHNRDYNSVSDDIIRAASTITGLTDLSTIRSYGTTSQDMSHTDQAVIPPNRRRRLATQTIDNLSTIPTLPTSQTQTQSQSQTLLSINDQLQQLQQLSGMQQSLNPTAQQIASTNHNHNRNNPQQHLQFLNELSNRDSTGNSNIPDHFQPLLIDENQDALAGNTDAKMNELDQHNTLTDSQRHGITHKSRNRNRRTHTRNLNFKCIR